ncbi:MAG: recombinase family protein [Candidatus Methylomirabilales bacterium]
MRDSRPAQITARHLQRLAVVYLRQSSPRQVEENPGSAAHQRNQKELALRWGWPEDSIEIIDQDLGLSGTSGESREGWQRLLQLVSQGQVGLILVSEISRLSRSRADFFTLAQLCRTFDVLLAVEGTIVEFDNPHDTFMANIRADFAEYENAIRRNTFAQAKLARARLGYAVSVCPTGYVCTEKGIWAKDPDARVQKAIEEVFRHYERLGTVGRVLRFYANHEEDQNFKLPIRRKEQVLWVRPTRGRIYHMLTNPAYCGSYSFRPRPPKGETDPSRRSRTDWSGGILFPDHHRAYISPALWREILEGLKSRRRSIRVPVGKGPALCQGLVRCGRCGRRMRVGYSHPSRGVRIAYRCSKQQVEYGQAACWSVPGGPLDELVARELLRRLAPPEVEAVLAVAEDVNAAYTAAHRQRQLELDRVRYEASRAEQRFKLVDPADPLVAPNLLNDWKLAAQKVRELENKQAETPLVPRLEMTPEALSTIRSLASDLPELWAAPSTTNDDRKDLLRLLIREVRVVAVSKVDFEVEITWAGGAVTPHCITRPFPGSAIARELAAQGRDAGQIAAELNRLGVKAPPRGGSYTREKVHHLLYSDARKAGTTGPPWPIYRERLRAPLTELTQVGWSHGVIAEEFNRRGLRSYYHRTPWNSNKIRWLQRALGIPSPPRVRVRRNSRAAVEPLRGPLTELAQAGWINAAIAAEFSRRGLRGFAARTHWNKDAVRYLRRLFGIPSSRDPGMRVRKDRPIAAEALRAPLTELVQAAWSDAAIAVEFNRRALRGWYSRTPWNRGKIVHLRHVLGIPSVGIPRVRVRKDRRIAAEALRAPLTELVQAGWSAGVIAEEFNRRDLPKWGHRDSWNKTKIYNLRRALGIRSVPGPRVRLRRSPPAAQAEG